MTTFTEEQAYDSICWSADVATYDELVQLLDKMPKLRYVKIDRLFVDNHGPYVFFGLAERGIRVFYDAKYIEIPSKLEALADAACRHNIWMVNCMAGGLSNMAFDQPADDGSGFDGLKRFADVCNENYVHPCAVSLLTTKTNDAVHAEYSFSREAKVSFYANQLVNAGFTHMVCSPRELRFLRSGMRKHLDGLKLVTPGIRPAGSSNDDQVNAMTPRQAMEAGSNLLVIGRPITNGNPAENLEAIVADIVSGT